MDARVASYEDDQGRAHTENARFFEYSSAANPIRAGLTPRLPFRLFPAALYADGPSRVIPLDLSDALKCQIASNCDPLFARNRDPSASLIELLGMAFTVLVGCG